MDMRRTCRCCIVTRARMRQVKMRYVRVCGVVIASAIERPEEALHPT